MDCPQTIQMMHQILPIFVPYSFVLLICVASFVSYLIYQEIIKTLKQRLPIRTEQVFQTYNVVQEAQEIATHAWASPSDYQTGIILTSDLLSHI